MVTELAIGFFDGVHLGHRRLIGAMTRRARARGARSVVYTFREHPAQVLADGRPAPGLLLSLRQRVEAIRTLGVDCVAAVHFTPGLAALSPEEFAAALRRRFPGLDTVFCGANWRFGAGGRGDAELLRGLGFAVRVVPYAVRGGEPVSSTRIRAAAAAGNLKLAASLLGRPYEVSGRVVRGKGLGGRIGFPTVNLEPDVAGPLPFGVYAVETPAGRAVANFGLAPTMGAAAWRRPVWEINFPDGLESPPPRRMSFVPRVFMRPERRFGSVEELCRAIRSDISAARCMAWPRRSTGETLK